MQAPKKLLVAGFAIATVASAGLFAHSAIAKGGSDLDSLATTIATKYHLNADQVKVTLDQFRQQKLAEREAAFTAELNQAVTDGKLTDKQKNDILTERATIKTKLASIKAMTDQTSRTAALKQLRADTKQWASDNNIPLRWLRASGYAMMGVAAAS